MNTNYPRPQMMRDSFLSLDGKWDFALMENGASIPEEFPDRITVPFCPESVASGLHMPILPRQTMVYRRKIVFPEGFLSDRTLLHFGAVDQTCRVWFNGTEIGSHAGGYLPFSFDVTEHIKEGENEITVFAFDPLDHDLPWGKQKYQRGGMWYTPVSGIWQTVWMESVSRDAVKSISVTNTLDSVTVTVDTEAPSFRITVPEIGYDALHTEKTVTVSIPSPRRWTPADPHLYEFTISTENDTVTSYFALRCVEIKKASDGFARVHLNGRPIFLCGVLDQGYFEDGIYTPTSPDAYEKDIVTMKKMGFNLLRKHIKVEPAIFYYLCDKLGMLVMQDFVNTGNYSFLRDTALPTVGIKKMPSFLAPRSRRAKAFFLECAEQTQAFLSHFPSVIAYTVFNEGWGQFDADRVTAYLQSRDPTRLYDATSGWFKKKVSDFDSRHIYFKQLKMKAGKKALFLSEFGGYAHRIEEHAWSKKVYGYKKFTDRKDFEDAVCSLFENEVLPLKEKGLCGFVYTQLSDVEEETNGLLTFDREVVKVDGERVREVLMKLN